MYSCEFSAAIIPGVSLTWSFINHSNMLNNAQETFLLFNIFGENCDMFFHASLMNKVQKGIFFSNIVVTMHSSNVFLFVIIYIAIIIRIIQNHLWTVYSNTL